MSANELLLWISARKQGSWRQFKSAVEELHLDLESTAGYTTSDDEVVGKNYGLPLHQELQYNLQRFGHVEFFTIGCPEGWRVTPPAIASVPLVEGWLGIICGARTRRLLGRLVDAATSIEVEIDKTSTPNWPDQLRLFVSDPGKLTRLAELTHMAFQADAPKAILMSLPAVNDPTMMRSTEIPFGKDWAIHRFSASSLGWKSAKQPDAVSSNGGLFRFSLRHQRYILYCQGGKAYSVPSQVGKYVVLDKRRRRVLRYERLEHHLSMSASCRPPLLIERALILCSGLPPTYDPNTGMLQYSGIPLSVAQLVAELLEQELG
jgi:hypothetical protein